MCKVSVIIPIFNTGAFLRRCVESVLGQTLTDIEVILVNDGSTDDSGKICDELAREDSRVIVIHKENEGVSIARNKGIEIAKGEYIGFVDSDDWIEPEMYYSLYNKAKETDSEIVMCDAVTKYDDKEDEEDTIYQLNSDVLIKHEDIYPKLLMEIAGSAWRCIYKNELLKDNDIIFPVGLKFSEDRIFNILALGYSSGLYYIKKAYYNRYIRNGSAVNKYYENMIGIALDARKRTMSAIDSAWQGQQEYKDMYENQTVGFALTAINNEFYKDSKSSFIKKYKNIKRICKNSDVKYAISVSNVRDIRIFFITHEMITALCVTAIVLNKRHGR